MLWIYICDLWNEDLWLEYILLIYIFTQCTFFETFGGQKCPKSQSTSEYLMEPCSAVIYSLRPKLYWSEQRKPTVMNKVLGPGVAVNIVKVMYNCAK